MSLIAPHDDRFAGVGPQGMPLKQLPPPPCPVPWNLSANDDGSRWPDTVEHWSWKSAAESMLVPRFESITVNCTRPPTTSGEKISPCLMQATNSSGSTRPAAMPPAVWREFVKMPYCPVAELPSSS